MLRKISFILLLFAFAVYGQQKRVAIINTVDDGEPPIEHLELSHLTDRMREIAVKTLSPKDYTVMTTQSMVAFFGSHESLVEKCKEADGCLARLGREISADYIGQGRIGRFGGDLTIKVELYGTESGNLVGSFTGTSKGVFGLLTVLEENTPDIFKNMEKPIVPVPVPVPVPVIQVDLVAQVDSVPVASDTSSLRAWDFNFTEFTEEKKQGKKQSSKSMWALNLLGGTFLYYGLKNNSEMNRRYDEYRDLQGSGRYRYDELWEEVERARIRRNTCYVLGIAALTFGLGWNIWF
ncbi:MAG: hypothetical protein LBC85_02610 [Fibromonadaceae bacterium]|jgi:hypothetical protein|nr:hypothetical protein [Fibromonadaceae bacterium]